jgi:glyoxylase-like metal-dependent hydrolase (beta-lactamase superfamily II)
MLSWAQTQEASPVQIGVEKVTGNIYMLTNGGGNVGVCVGEDGALVIDTMIASFTEQMKATLAEITAGKPVRFVINTHWHYDHVEGNEALAKAGAIIFAHENVRKRTSTEQYIEFFNAKIPPAQKIALPLITFSHEMTLHLNGEEVYVFHTQPAHTDGDAIIYFRKANVIHLGDLYFAGMYPFIDTSSGGSVNEVITVLHQLLAMMDDSTKVIPGHGPLSNKAELKVYVAMLTTLRDRVSQQIKAGKTLEEILACKPTQEFDAVWGRAFMKPDPFVKLLYIDLIRVQ